MSESTIPHHVNDIVILGAGEVITANTDFSIDNTKSLRKIISDLLAEPLNEAMIHKGKYRITAMITIHKEEENAAAPPSND